jgi:hypothetical protein
VELSPEAIQISSRSSIIQCSIQGTMVNALYNPMIGANIMSNFFTLTFLGNETLALASKIFKSSSGSLVKGYGILQNVSV